MRWQPWPSALRTQIHRSGTTPPSSSRGWWRTPARSMPGSPRRQRGGAWPGCPGSTGLRSDRGARDRLPGGARRGRGRRGPSRWWQSFPPTSRRHSSTGAGNDRLDKGRLKAAATTNRSAAAAGAASRSVVEPRPAAPRRASEPAEERTNSGTAKARDLPAAREPAARRAPRPRAQRSPEPTGRSTRSAAPAAPSARRSDAVAAAAGAGRR